jgi:hypothetical protein
LNITMMLLMILMVVFFLLVLILFVGSNLHSSDCGSQESGVEFILLYFY